MFKFFKKKEEKKEVKEVYKVALCDENDLATKFGEDREIFDTYYSTDFYIRMSWNLRKEAKENDGYWCGRADAWLVIEKVTE